MSVWESDVELWFLSGAVKGAEERPYFEPFLIEYLAHFNNLMEAYQAREVEQ